MKVKEVNRLLSLSEYPLGAMVIIDISLQGKPICIVCCCIVRRDQMVVVALADTPGACFVERMIE